MAGLYELSVNVIVTVQWLTVEYRKSTLILLLFVACAVYSKEYLVFIFFSLPHTTWEAVGPM